MLTTNQAKLAEVSARLDGPEGEFVKLSRDLNANLTSNLLLPPPLTLTLSQTLTALARVHPSDPSSLAPT